MLLDALARKAALVDAVEQEQHAPAAIWKLVPSAMKMSIPVSISRRTHS